MPLKTSKGRINNNDWDSFIHDRLTKQTTRVSVATGGGQGNGGGSNDSSLSADGRYVAVGSAANNLVAVDNNGVYDVFIRDRYFFPDNPTDLKITAASKPASLAVNGLGSYTYTLANVGLFPSLPTWFQTALSLPSPTAKALRATARPIQKPAVATVMP